MTKNTHKQFEHAIALILRDSVRSGDPPDEWERRTVRFLHSPKKMVCIPVEPSPIRTNAPDKALVSNVRLAVKKTLYVVNPVTIGLTRHTHGLSVCGVSTICETAAIPGISHRCTCGRILWDER